MAEGFERKNLRVEVARLNNELEIKRAEIRIREKEIAAAQERASGERRGLTAPVATALAAAATLIGGITGAAINGYLTRGTSIGVELEKGNSAIELEKLKFQTGLILKAIDTRDQLQAVKTLKFFANAGLIPNFKRDVLALAEKDEGREVPTIGPVDFEPLDSSARTFVPYLAQIHANDFPYCTGFALPQKMILTANYCLREDRPKLSDLSITFGSFPRERYQVTKIIEVNKDAGIAILQYAALETQPYPKAEPLRFRNPILGENLFVLSFSTESLVASKRNCVVTHESEAIGFTANSSDRIMSAANLFTYRCKVAEGGGGGPIFALDNSVIGIVYATDRRQSEWGKRAADIVRLSPALTRIFSAGGIP